MKSKEIKGKRLLRSKKNRMIAGVCAGIGDYFGVERDINQTLVLFEQIPDFGPALLKDTGLRPTNEALDTYLLAGKKQISENLDLTYTPLG